MNIELLNGEVVDLGPSPSEADVREAHEKRGLGAAYAKNAEVAEAYRAARASGQSESEALAAVTDGKADVALLVRDAKPPKPSEEVVE